MLIGGRSDGVAAGPPIGLIHVGLGGSKIKEFSYDNSMSTCHDGCSRDHGGVSRYQG